MSIFVAAVKIEAQLSYPRIPQVADISSVAHLTACHFQLKIIMKYLLSVSDRR